MLHRVYMMGWVSSLGWISSTVLIVGLSSLFYAALLVFLRRRLPAEALKRHHDVAGFVLSVVGVLYSVLLGFMVVNTQNRYDSVLLAMNEEASCLGDLYRDGAIFKPQETEALHAAIVNYINYVIQEEWPALASNKASYDNLKTSNDLWAALYAITPVTDKENIWYSQAIRKMNEFVTARLKRVLNLDQHIGPMMWTLLLAGAGITIGFMFFFSLDNLYAHMLILAVLSGYTNFLLYLVYCLDHVFGGPLALAPNALIHLLDRIKNWH